MTIDVRPAARADVRELSATLGRAFYDDPVAMWVLPRDNSRAARLSKFFATMTRHHQLAGGGVEVASDGAGTGAAALWDPPNGRQQSPGVEEAGEHPVLRTFRFHGDRRDRDPWRWTDLVADVACTALGLRLATGGDGQSVPMAADTGDGIDPSDFPEEGGPGDTLNQSESTDSDEILNDDGDVVVDPPEGWSGVDKFGITAREEREGEPLDDRLAAEEPDVTDVTDEYLQDGPPGRAHRGQIDGAPEDGDSLFDVVDESGNP